MLGALAAQGPYRRKILRLYRERGRRRNAAAALEEAAKAGLRAPRLMAHSSTDAGFGAPVVLMSFVEGHVELRPADNARGQRELAAELAAIHRHTAVRFAWRYRSWVNRSALAPPDWTTVPSVWERAIELVLGAEPEYRPVFLHRDFHPANVLWHHGAVNGVVDWINACRGLAGVDVAHCRTDLALIAGAPAADQFLDTYARPRRDLSTTGIGMWTPSSICACPERRWHFACLSRASMSRGGSSGSP